MTTPDEAPAEKTRKKFKYTQQLVNISLEELTQDEIAKLCRVSQSIVSGWKHGQSRAYEHQLAELKKRFGHRLHRATFRVYLALVRPPEVGSQDWEPMRTIQWEAEERRTRWVPRKVEAEPAKGTNPGAQAAEGPECDPAPAGDWAPAVDSPRVRAGSSFARRRRQPEVPEYTAPKMEEEEYFERVERSRREIDPDGLRIVQVEGPVTLRHTLHRPIWNHHQRPERDPVARWLVHHVGRGRFVLVRQWRRLHQDPERQLWAHGSPSYGAWNAHRMPVEANDDAARWLSWVEGPLTPDDLLLRADAAPASEPVVLGAALLPFLVRKMLVELGYPVAGVERIGADD